MSRRPIFSRLRALLVVAPVLLLTGCSKNTDWGFPEGVSSVNDQSLSLWQGAWITAGVVGVFTLILLDFRRYGKFVSDKPLMDGVVIYYFFNLQAKS
jgi:hypothetical protein